MWLAAEYSESLIIKWFADKKWEITSGTISYYRSKWADEIAAARVARREAALSEGLALKAERVRRLVEHADELEAIKWLADKKSGRLWNEKAWRETLDDIAREMGERRPDIEGKLAEFLDQLQHILSPAEYARALAFFAAGQVGGRTSGE